MSKGPLVQVEGTRELRRTLRRAGDDLSDLRDVHGRVGTIVSSAARAEAPHRTGRLAGSVRAARTTTAAIVRAGYASVPYAGPIHWGWPARGITAQPFLSDAATGSEAQWLPVYEKAISAALDKVKGTQA